jgi:hypothetical protein
MWNRGIQAAVITVIGKSSRHLTHTAAEEVLEDTHQYCIAGSGTSRGRFNISRVPDQDLESKESCQKAQDDQVFQDPMEQPYCIRSNMGK